MVIRRMMDKASERSLYRVYLSSFASTSNSNSNSSDMDGARFVRLCRDCGLFEFAQFTVTDAGTATAAIFVCEYLFLDDMLDNISDLIFQKSKKAGNYAKKVTYEEFR